MDPCAFDDCEHEAAPRSAYCNGHRKQRELDRPLTPLRKVYRTPWEVLTEAALAYAEANSADPVAWKRARDRLRTAAKRYLSATTSHK